MQNLPIFADQGSERDVERLESGIQTVIPAYSFDCYGNVTEWRAYVERHGGNVRYNLVFQVWRRSGGGQRTTGEYDFVGSNSFQSINPPPRGRIDRPVLVEQQIKVRPGDVIGLYVTTSGDNGVELKQQDTSNGETLIIWFATSLPAALSTRIRVGSTNGYELMLATTAVPVITAVVVPSTSLPLPTPLSSSSGLLPESVLATTSVHVLQPPPLTQTGTSQTTQTLQTRVSVQSSALSSPQPSSFLPSPNTTTNPVGPGLPVGVIVAIVVLIVVVLGVLILVFILALALRRRSNKPPDNHSVLGN